MWGIMVEGRPTAPWPEDPVPLSPSTRLSQRALFPETATLENAPRGGPCAPPHLPAGLRPHRLREGLRRPFGFLPPRERLQLAALEFLPTAAGEWGAQPKPRGASGGLPTGPLGATAPAPPGSP